MLYENTPEALEVFYLLFFQLKSNADDPSMSLKQINEVIQSEKCISHIKNLIDYHLVIKSEKE